jgi:hypothetical protein
VDSRIQIVAIIASAGLLLLVLELVRQRRLLERYTLLWLFSAAVLVDQSKVPAQRIALLEERRRRSEPEDAELAHESVRIE